MTTKTTHIEIGYRTFIRLCIVTLGFGVAGFLIYKSIPALVILGAALFLAVAISPLVNKLSDILPGQNRPLSITVAYFLVVGFLAAFIAIVGPTVINESIKFANNLPQILRDATAEGSVVDNISQSFGIENGQEQIVNTISDFTNSFTKDLGSVITTSVTGIANVSTAVILVLVLSLFMLTEGPAILKKFWRNFSGNPEAKRASKVFDRMASVIAKYVANAISVAIINATCTAIAVFILSLIFSFDAGLALPFGLITGVFCLIPMFGSFIGGTLVSLLLAFNGPIVGIIFFVYTIIYLQIESNFISPKIQGKGLQLPALVILASVTIGVYMFGLIGAIVAIPIAGCIKVLLEEYANNIPFIESKA